MRIPLDYYRILGLPIQATAEQLKQSHRDRTLQVPRREYSELAIEARRQLIDMAYSVLGDSMRRAEYDQEFLAASKSLSQSSGQAAGETEELDAQVPSIEIENHQLVGGTADFARARRIRARPAVGPGLPKARRQHSPKGSSSKCSQRCLILF